MTETTRDAVRFAAERARLAIVSGAAREEIVPVVAAAGLGELFATVVADDDVALGKPDPGELPARARSARRRRRGDARLRGHRSRRRVREGCRHACGRRARDAGARAARAGRRGGRDDRRPVAPAPARMTWTIAHRGASAELPENTPAAFERAIELGADFVEFDVHAAADGSLVVCHDPPVGGEPRLEEVVDQCAGRIGLMCELKSPWRYRRHDVVARTVALLPGRRSRRLLRAARAAAGARSAHAAARRPRRLDPPCGALRLGSRLLGSARPARAGLALARRLGSEDDRLHGQRRAPDARARRRSASTGSSLTGRSCCWRSSEAEHAGVSPREAHLRRACRRDTTFGARGRRRRRSSRRRRGHLQPRHRARGTCARSTSPVRRRRRRRSQAGARPSRAARARSRARRRCGRGRRRSRAACSP